MLSLLYTCSTVSWSMHTDKKDNKSFIKLTTWGVFLELSFGLHRQEAQSVFAPKTVEAECAKNDCSHLSDLTCFSPGDIFNRFITVDVQVKRMKVKQSKW